MRNVSKILAVVDPTVEEQPAMRRAAWLASATGAELELLVCYYNAYLSDDCMFPSPSLENARREIIGNQTDHLEEFAAPIRTDGGVVTTSAIWDHPLYRGIVRHALASGADLVIKDTHHHSAVARALLTNTDWHLIRTCPTPLWLVKPNTFDDAPTFVAAIDPMHEHSKPAALDDEVLEISRMLADQVGGRVQLVSGMAPEELPIIAKGLEAAVVVMGAMERNRLQRLFIGETAERTMEHLPCDLLIVKPDWFETPVEAESHEAA